MTKKRFKVSDMSCSACSAAVERCVRALDGIDDVNVSLLAGEMNVSYEENTISAEKICEAVSGAGYPTKVMENRQMTYEEPKSEYTAKRLISSIVLTVVLMYFSMGHMLGLPTPSFLTGNGILLSAGIQMVLAAAVMIINHQYFTGGIKAIFRRAPQYGYADFYRSRRLVSIWSCHFYSDRRQSGKQSGRGSRLYGKSVFRVRRHDSDTDYRWKNLGSARKKKDDQCRKNADGACP